MTSLDYKELSQLKWRCRRGIKELDIVLTRFLEKHYEQENDEDSGDEKKAFKMAFKELLNLEDPVLYAMLLGQVVPTDAEQCLVINDLRNLSSTSG